MKKIVIAIICAKALLAETYPMVKFIADMGNIMRQKQINVIMFFVNAEADRNMVISKFIFKPQDENSTEQVKLIQELRKSKEAQKEVIKEFAAENKELLCKSKLLPKLKEIDLVYVYRFGFENEESIEETSISARECPN